MSDFTETIKAINILDRMTEWADNFTDPAYLATQPTWLAELLEELKPLVAKSQPEIQANVRNGDERSNRLERQGRKIDDLEKKLDREGRKIFDLEKKLDREGRKIFDLEKKLDNALAKIDALETTNDLGPGQESINDQVAARCKNIETDLTKTKTLLTDVVGLCISVGLAEMRRELLRKLQGEFKLIPAKDHGPKPKSDFVNDLTDTDNADDLWAKDLRKEDFNKLKTKGKDLLWIWCNHRMLLQDGRITAERNEFVHSKPTRNYFAAAMRHASEDEDSESHHYLKAYESLFEYTYNTSVDEAADEARR